MRQVKTSQMVLDKTDHRSNKGGIRTHLVLQRSEKVVPSNESDEA